MKKTIQNILSSVKTALTSDTGKAIGMGLGAAALGGAIGGEGGVRLAGALGQAVTNARERKKREEREAEDRDLRKLQMTKAELDLSNAKDRRLYEKQLEMSGLQLEEKREDIMKKRIANATDQYKATSASDKYGKISAHDVAIEDKVKTVKKPEFKPTPVARTGPGSAMVSDEEQLIKNVEKIQGSAAGDAAKLAMNLGVVGAGRDYLLKNRADLAREVQSYGFEPEYEKAFWRELQEQIAPGSIARAKAMLGTEPELTKVEQIAMAQPDAAGTSIGATVGGAAGSTFGTAGIMAGTVAGGLVGGYIGRGIYRAMDSQKDVAPTPAVAGADKTAADMAAYSMSPEATKLLIGLKNTIQPQDVSSVIQQLPQLADFKALPVGDQERIISELQNITPGFGSRVRLMPPEIGPYYRPQDDIQVVKDIRNTINDMGSWATRKLGIGR